MEIVLYYWIVLVGFPLAALLALRGLVELASIAMKRKEQ
jgi:hypothetical protein